MWQTYFEYPGTTPSPWPAADNCQPQQQLRAQTPWNGLGAPSCLFQSPPPPLNETAGATAWQEDRSPFCSGPAYHRYPGRNSTPTPAPAMRHVKQSSTPRMQQEQHAQRSPARRSSFDWARVGTPNPTPGRWQYDQQDSQARRDQQQQQHGYQQAYNQQYGQHQHQHSGQFEQPQGPDHSLRLETFQLQMQQHADGSYEALLLPEQEAGNYQGGGSRRRRKLRPVRAGGATAAASTDPDDVNSLLELLPRDRKLLAALAPYVSPAAGQPYLVDLAADLGRPVNLRLSDRSCVELDCNLNINAALGRLSNAVGRRQHGGRVAHSDMFSDVNRLGVPGSLHRISAMKDRQGVVYGLTYRVGRHVLGVADLLADVLSSMRAAVRGTDNNSDASSLVPSIAAQPAKGLLLLGRPGVGKTTLLRDVARLMSSPHSKGGLGMSVVVVDTSNEIAGDCEQPHACIGNARRMMVPFRHQQAAVMMEAVCNHSPEVIIVDEIATKEEAAACRAIAARGVLLVSTAHGSSLSDLLANPELSGLVGGVKAVTLGDRTAVASNGGHKTRLERGGAVTFGSLVEILATDRWRLHPDVGRSVDSLLAHSTSSSGSMAELAIAPQAPKGAETQLRSRTGPEMNAQLLVCFECGMLPATAAWAADELQQQQQQYPGRKRGWGHNSSWGGSRARQWPGRQQQQQQPRPWKRARTGSNDAQQQHGGGHVC